MSVLVDVQVIDLIGPSQIDESRPYRDRQGNLHN
jgi:hypothetical protein